MGETLDKPPETTKHHQPNFLVTIDAEGDNLWSKPRTITTRNADYLHRFQALCESYGLRPTYLTNYEMANSRSFQEFGKDVLKRRTAEIGMHLHAWNTPPLIPLTKDDFAFQPYLIEYPEAVMQEKITVITDLLEETFGVKMISHRAGRWGFNGTYGRALVAKGYRVDCSVTPHVSWTGHLGDPDGAGGTDYSRFPVDSYFLDLNDISRSGDSPLLEVPMTIVLSGSPSMDWLRRPLSNLSLARRALNRLFPWVYWLRPDRKNRDDLVRIVRQAARDKKPYVEFMLHSSELMPGGSPIFPTSEDVERLYHNLEVLFGVARETCVGTTLREFYEQVLADHAQAEGRPRPFA